VVEQPKAAWDQTSRIVTNTPVVKFKISCNIDKDAFVLNSAKLQDTSFEVELLLEPLSVCDKGYEQAVAEQGQKLQTKELHTLAGVCRLFTKIHFHAAQLLDARAWEGRLV
jgi:hypothetical protein